MSGREDALEQEGAADISRIRPPDVRPDPVPPPSQTATRRRRIRQALSSAPQLRDMVIVQELLEPPVGIRSRP